jgi:hypothetical protein
MSHALSLKLQMAAYKTYCFDEWANLAATKTASIVMPSCTNDTAVSANEISARKTGIGNAVLNSLIFLNKKTETHNSQAVLGLGTSDVP